MYTQPIVRQRPGEDAADAGEGVRVGARHEARLDHLCRHDPSADLGDKPHARPEEKPSAKNDKKGTRNGSRHG